MIGKGWQRNQTEEIESAPLGSGTYYAGKSISKLQMDIDLKQMKVLI
jgi:hypothetical protein